MFKKNRILLLILLIQFFLNFNFAFSINIKKIVIEPLNRINIYFDSDKLQFNHYLSDDKKNINIYIDDNLKFKDTLIKSEGIIENIIFNNNSNPKIKITLKEKRGYNLLFLPTSNNLMIEIFQWDKLSTLEDKFRTSLLSFNNSITDIPIDDLQPLVKEKVSNVSSILGLIYFKKGLINTSEKLLNYSIFLNDNIPEVYAALYLINSIKGNFDLANQNKNHFFSKTALDTIYNVEYEINNINDEQEILKFSYIDSLLLESNETSLTKKNQDTIILKDFPTENKQDNAFNKLILYIVLIFSLFIISVISLYLKWRKNKINELIESKKIKIPGKKAISNKITEVYKKNEPKKDDIKPNSNESNKTFEINKAKEKENILNVIKQVTEEIKQSEKLKKEQENTEKFNQSYNIPAKVEIALNIQEEQKKLRNKNLEELKTTVLPIDKSKLTEVSKKLGIEVGGLEIKKEIDKLLNDEKELQNLKSKFIDKSE